jgi:hypothetical protein
MATPIDRNAFKGGKKSLVYKGRTTALGPQIDVPAGLKPFSQLGLPMSGAAVLVKTAGQVIDGFDLRQHDIVIQADNVTLRNCLLNATSWHALNNTEGRKGLKVECNFFDGEKADNSNSDMLFSEAPAEVIGNIFMNTPTDQINVQGGKVSRNAFVGTGYQTGAHADGHTTHKSTGPLEISENYFDLIDVHDGKTGANACVKLVSHFGAMDSITVKDNIMLGGGYNTYCGDGGAGKPSNVKYIGNLMGSSNYGDTESYFIMGGPDPSLRGPGWEWTNNTKFSAAPANTVSIGGAAPPVTPGKPVCKTKPVVEGGANVGDPAITASGVWENVQPDWTWEWDWMINGNPYGDTTYKTIAPEPGALTVKVTAGNAAGKTAIVSDPVTVAGEILPPDPPEPGDELPIDEIAQQFDVAGKALSKAAALMQGP